MGSDHMCTLHSGTILCFGAQVIDLCASPFFTSCNKKSQIAVLRALNRAPILKPQKKFMPVYHELNKARTLMGL